jgi:hypothetical protein
MFQTAFGPVVSELADFLNDISSKRFGIVAQVMQEAIDSNELRGGDAASLALLFCSIMDHHANTLTRLPKPGQKLRPELADALVDAFLYGVAAGRRKTRRLVELPSQNQTIPIPRGHDPRNP